MSRIKMGTLAELPVGGVLEKRIMARRVAVFNIAGQLYGIESDCKHMRASLANGEVKDGVLTCRWHHWRYNLETGECLDLEGARLKRYDVEIEGDAIFVTI
jgi:nitrite reductase/ring-hydroxylating ferredoxin subunit